MTMAPKEQNKKHKNTLGFAIWIAASCGSDLMYVTQAIGTICMYRCIDVSMYRFGVKEALSHTIWLLRAHSVYVP